MVIRTPRHMGDKRPYISIIIVAYNTGEGLIACLRSLSLQTHNDFECLVIDNASQDVTGLSEFNIRYFRLDHNYGPSYARNYGVAHAKGEIMVFIDDDAVPQVDLVAVLTKTFQDAQVVAVRGKVIPKIKNRVYNLLPGHYDLGDSILESPLTTECNCAVRKKAFLRVGGFDPKLYGHEGVELSYRLIGSGKQLYIPDAVVYHDFGESLWTLLKKQYRHGYNKKMFAEKFPEIVAYSNQFLFLFNVEHERKLDIWKRVQVIIIAALSMGADRAGVVMYEILVVLLKGEVRTHTP